MDSARETYRGFEYWLVETTALGQRLWRIQFPGGHKTPPIKADSEADVKVMIDDLVLKAGA